MQKTYTFREFRRLLINNGYTYVRCKGDHFTFAKGDSNVVITKDLNRMIARRLIKENELKEY